MDKVTVYVYPDDKHVEAYTYGETALLIPSTRVYDTDTSVATVPGGFRFKRFIRENENEWTTYYEYRRM